MAYTMTISSERELHNDFKRYCAENDLKVSTEINNYMRSAISGTEKRFRSLEEKVKELDEIVKSIDPDKSEKGDNF